MMGRVRVWVCDYQLVEEGDQGLQVLFDGEVEGVAVFEVDGDWSYASVDDCRERCAFIKRTSHDSADIFDGQQLARLAFAEPS